MPVDADGNLRGDVAGAGQDDGAVGQRQEEYARRPIRHEAGIIDRRALLLGAAMIAPSIIATALTREAAWSRGGVIAMSALIVFERSGLAPVGIVIFGVAIVLGATLLLVVAPYAFLSAATIAALAAGCFVVTARGQRLRSLATFTFIPILYVGFEMREGGAAGIMREMRSLAAVTVLAVAPVIVVATVCHHRGRTGGYARHMARMTRWADHGARDPVLRLVVATIVGTATAALAATWLNLPHGQWAIWSAASVISAEAVMRKLRDRVVGALIGVPIGIIAGLLLPPSTIVASASAAVGLLTLIAIRPYRLAFGTRCAGAALVLVTSHQSSLAAAERVEGIVLGGVIGLIAVGLSTVSLRRHTER